jgi:hypothetical protein
MHAEDSANLPAPDIIAADIVENPKPPAQIADDLQK